MWLQDSPISAVAENFGLSWDEADGIMRRAVNRGLSRRKQQEVKNLGVDETSYQKGHKYSTIILDKDRDSVIDVLDDRKAGTLETWLKTQQTVDLTGLASISMDMWDAYIKAVKAWTCPRFGTSAPAFKNRLHLSRAAVSESSPVDLPWSRFPSSS